MDPDPPLVSDKATTRTVSPHEMNETGTPEKTPSLKWAEPTWAERLLSGCSPRVAVMDVWASAEIELAAKTMGILYLGTSSPKREEAEPYDCVLSLLPKKKHAVAFCYLALRAWASLLPGGHMVLVLKEAVYVAMRRFLPPSPLPVKIEEDGTKLAYVWRKPIYKTVGDKTRHKARPHKPAAR